MAETGWPLGTFYVIPKIFFSGKVCPGYYISIMTYSWYFKNSGWWLPSLLYVFFLFNRWANPMNHFKMNSCQSNHIWKGECCFKWNYQLFLICLCLGLQGFVSLKKDLLAFPSQSQGWSIHGPIWAGKTSRFTVECINKNQHFLTWWDWAEMSSGF